MTTCTIEVNSICDPTRGCNLSIICLNKIESEFFMPMENDVWFDGLYFYKKKMLTTQIISTAIKL